MLLDGKLGQKRLDFGYPHLTGRAFVVKENITPDPIDVGLFSA